MSGIIINEAWSAEAQQLCRDYNSLCNSLEHLPVNEAVAIARQIATDLVFRLSELHRADPEVEAALTSISAVCQSLLFNFTRFL